MNKFIDCREQTMPEFVGFFMDCKKLPTPNSVQDINEIIDSPKRLYKSECCETFDITGCPISIEKKYGSTSHDDPSMWWLEGFILDNDCSELHVTIRHPHYVFMNIVDFKIKTKGQRIVALDIPILLFILNQVDISTEPDSSLILGKPSEKTKEILSSQSLMCVYDGFSVDYSDIGYIYIYNHVRPLKNIVIDLARSNNKLLMRRSNRVSIPPTDSQYNTIVFSGNIH